MTICRRCEKPFVGSNKNQVYCQLVTCNAIYTKGQYGEDKNWEQIWKTWGRFVKERIDLRREILSLQQSSKEIPPDVNNRLLELNVYLGKNQ